MDDPSAPSCCRPDGACAFEKALLARAACCRHAQRRSEAEGEWIACSVPVARINCTMLVELLRERSTFALKLPRRPLMHAQVLRLQCGGVQALQSALQASEDDVHGLVVQAQQRFGSLVDLPWPAIVAEIAAWQPRRRRAPRRE